MERILNWKITKDQEGMTIDQFLRTRGCSHHVLTHLKRTECGILCNGVWAYTNQKLKLEDELEIHLIESEASDQILPVALPLDIVYEDEDLLVVNKASDMPIHPSINNYENTLANAVMYHYKEQGVSFVYRCINRLDRDTSGLLIIAKNMMSGAILSQMSARREIHREYLTIVEGCLPEEGTIDAPIARLEGSAIMRCVDEAHGETAVTHFKRLTWIPCSEHSSLADTGIISYSDAGLQIAPTDSYKSASIEQRGLSLASVRLETGRTHQIRVHMKHIGHPMIGDFLYNPDAMDLIQRQALHSHRLTFHHPITGELLDFTCEMPEDMRRVLDLSK